MFFQMEILYDLVLVVSLWVLMAYLWAQILVALEDLGPED